MMKRTHAITALFALGGMLTAPALAADKSPSGPEVKRFAPLMIATTDGRKGVVSAQTAGGKTSYYFTLGGKPAAPGIYNVAGGQHVKVIGVDGLVDPVNSTIMLNPQPLPP
jgi:hypothetical protein